MWEGALSLKHDDVRITSYVARGNQTNNIILGYLHTARSISTASVVSARFFVFSVSSRCVWSSLIGLYQSSPILRPRRVCSTMTYVAYLLVPIYPILAIFCLLTFIYERAVLNEQERVEDTFIATQYFLIICDAIAMVLSVPFSVPYALLDLLCGCGPLVMWPAVLILSPLPWLWGLVRDLIWDTLFHKIVPAGYSLWNSRVYQDLRRDSQHECWRFFPALGQAP